MSPQLALLMCLGLVKQLFYQLNHLSDSPTPFISPNLLSHTQASLGLICAFFPLYVFNESYPECLEDFASSVTATYIAPDSSLVIEACEAGF